MSFRQVQRPPHLQRIPIDIKMVHYYERYKKDYAHKYPQYVCSKKFYSKVFGHLMERVIEMLIYENKGLHFPYINGSLRILKEKPEPKFRKDGELINRPPVDYKKTKELWERDPEAKENKQKVYHTNEHTNGYVMKWYFTRDKMHHQYKPYYMFKISQLNKERLTEALLKHGKELNYFQKKKY